MSKDNKYNIRWKYVWENVDGKYGDWKKDNNSKKRNER